MTSYRLIEPKIHHCEDSSVSDDSSVSEVSEMWRLRRVDENHTPKNILMKYFVKLISRQIIKIWFTYISFIRIKFSLIVPSFSRKFNYATSGFMTYETINKNLVEGPRIYNLALPPKHISTDAMQF